MLLLLLLLSAQEPEVPAVRASVAPKTWINLRGGFGPTALPLADAVGARPQICAELTPFDDVGIEACGTGGGFLFEPSPEIAHFRAKLKVASFDVGYGFVEPHVSAGFAELQIGDDGSGFDFFGTGATGVETAGPEAGASLRWSMALPYDFELLADAQLNLAYFGYAERLATPMSTLQPSALVTVGVGW